MSSNYNIKKETAHITAVEYEVNSCEGKSVTGMLTVKVSSGYKKGDWADAEAFVGMTYPETSDTSTQVFAFVG